MQSLDTAFDGSFVPLSSVPLVLHIHDTGLLPPYSSKGLVCVIQEVVNLYLQIPSRHLRLGVIPATLGTATLVAAVLHANAPLLLTANTQAAVDWHYNVRPHRLRHKTDANVNVNINATIGVFILNLHAATHDLCGALMV
ncbi:hypothetical protein ColLi_09097 [Colletotrichum liriopes]|uniref:Uncharacterized protein n=1 Tax=Colletotrichum liriopes TaxID=708192 RepID=A0AA37LVF9_9PEZI|nr:hypothetical protein ColLi_09097 [Colletotrichum liriopes]